MDFLERLVSNINSVVDLPLECKLGYLDSDDALILQSLEESGIKKEYFDGMKDLQLKLQLFMKSNSQNQANDILWNLVNYLNNLDDVPSNNNSYEFVSLTVTDTPFTLGVNESGLYTFSIKFQADLMVHNKKEK